MELMTMFCTTFTLVLCSKINVCLTVNFEVLQMLSVSSQCCRALEAKAFNQINLWFSMVLLFPASIGPAHPL